MAYNPVTWANGNYVTAAKLNTMDANSDHNRHEAEYKMIYSAMIGEPRAGYVFPVSNFRLYVAGVWFGSEEYTFTASDGWQFHEDIDISSLTDNALHKLSIRPNSQVYDLDFLLFKTPDIERLTICYYIDYSSPSSIEVNQIIVYGHNSDETFSAY